MKTSEQLTTYENFDPETNYLEEEISSQNKFNPDTAFAKSWAWKELSAINSRQLTQKSADLIKNFNEFLSSLTKTIYDKDSKTSFVGDYFRPFEYIFQTLSPEFQRSTMHKLLEALNTSMNTNVDSNGVYRTINIRSYHNPLNISSEVGVLAIFEEFQKMFIFNEKYIPIFDDIKKTSRPDNTKTLIQTALYNLPVDISKKWIDCLWSKEEQKLDYINLKALAENNNQAFSYLVGNFKGWENKNFLNIFFQNAYLGISTIEQLEKNIGKIAVQVQEDPIEILLKRKDLSDSGKIDILKILFSDLSHNSSVLNFLYDYLLNGSTQKEIFEAKPFFFSKSLQNQISNWETLEKIYPKIDKLIKAKLIDVKELEVLTNLLLNLEPEKDLRNINPNLFLGVAGLLNNNLNSEQKEKILFKIYCFAMDEQQNSNHAGFFFPLYESWKNDINIDTFSIQLQENLKQHSAGSNKARDYLKLSSICNEAWATVLFEAIYKDYKKSILNSVCADQSNSNIWIKSIFQHNKGWDYFSHLFKIDTATVDGYSTYYESYKTQFNNIFLTHLKNVKPDFLFNLNTYNPATNFLDSMHYHFKELRKEHKYDIGASEEKLLKNMCDIVINQIFEGKLNDYKCSDSLVLRDKLFVISVDLNINLKNIVNTPVEKSNFSLRNFFNSKPVEEIQLPTTLTIKNKKIILNNEIEELPQEGIKRSVFISTANKEYNQIKTYLDSVKEKPLNMEVKIKSNNLMMDYLNFVTLIDSAKEIVDLEDMHFLENNLGSYLLESLKSYTKNVDRYDIMQKAHDSGNFKKLFSGKTEEDIQKIKERSDTECLRWIKLLEEQLELVKKNVIDQLTDDSLKDMKIRTKFFSARFPEGSVDAEMIEKQTAVKLR